MPCLGLATGEPQPGDEERGAAGTVGEGVCVGGFLDTEPAFGLQCECCADVAAITDLNLAVVRPGAGSTGAVVKVGVCDIVCVVVLKSQKGAAYRDD